MKIKKPATPIFPGRLQPSIVGTTELNYCVRDGNRCDLSVIVTGIVEGKAPSRLHKKLIDSSIKNHSLAVKSSIY